MPATTLATACALHFSATDEDGKPFAEDAAVVARARSDGPEEVVTALARLDTSAASERAVVDAVSRAFRWVVGRTEAGLPIVPDYFQTEEG
jgi:hypothetical protein